MKKKLSGGENKSSSENKSFTVRMDSERIADAKDRAGTLGMTQSSYVSELIKADLEHGIMEMLPGVLPEMDPDEAKEMMDKLSSAGYIVSADTGVSGGDRTVVQHTPAQSPPDPIRAMKDNLRRPNMQTIDDLVAQSKKGGMGPQQAMVFGGADGGLKNRIRQARINSVKEERAEKEMRKKILEELPDA